MYTFVIISYNQEEYIIEHLESIKYQIEQFGNGMEINLILSDDCSTDNTVKFAGMWLESNPTLFKDVQVQVNKRNLGIVKNYLQATGAVKTPYYNLLDGDDMYYKNNVFETMNHLDQNDILFTPVIAFDGITKEFDWFVDNLLALKKKETIKSYLRHSQPFHTSGTFTSIELMHDQGLRSFISDYNWIEDLPSFHYMFHVKESLDYAIHYKPYAFHRYMVGISKNPDNDKYRQFIEEEKRMKENLGMLQGQRGFNADYIKVAFDYRWIPFMANYFPKNREIKRRLDLELGPAKEHLMFLEEKSKQFIQSITQ